MTKIGFDNWPTQLKCALLMLLFMWATPSLSRVYTMDFPVRLNNAEVGQVPAIINGLELKSVSAASFKKNLQGILSQKVLTWLSNKAQQELTPEEFEVQGIFLSLQPQDLTINMSLSEAAMATDNLSYARQKHFELPKGEAYWAVLNNFNFAHERSNNNQSYNSQFEWLINSNVGGGDGINFSSSVFWENGDSQPSQFSRGDIALFYDQPDKPLRMTLGDTQTSSIGHLLGTQLAGFKIEKAYSQLQPQRKTTPGNSQQFVLPRPATLEVFINEFLISRIRLKAGRYDLSDLPLTSGINNIHIIATYANGETQTFDFTTHYNSRLLAQGISDYSLAFGYLSAVDNGRYRYDDDMLITGNYEYGVTDKLTLGVNGAVHSLGHILGSVTTLNSLLGNISLRYSQSKAPQASGDAYSIETEHSIFGHGNYGSPNLRLGYEIRKNFTNTPWQQFNTISNTKRTFLDYSYIINDHLDFNINASRAVNNDNLVTKNVSSEFNLRYEGIRLRVGYNHNASEDLRIISENQFILNVTWNYYDSQNNTRSRAQYNNRSKTASTSYTKTNNNFINDYGYELRAEKGSDFRQEQMKASYTGAFFRADVNANNYTHTRLKSDGRASINLSTSVGVADGYLGLGATTTTPFAVVTKHKTLKNTDVLVNTDRFGRAKTKPDERIGALIDIGSSYTSYQFNIDVPDAPLGYDWGPGMYTMVGGANTGHHIQIGSDLSYTVIGTLLDEQGIPIAMQRGYVMKQQNDITSNEAPLKRAFFTNRTGRFVIEGISTGNYVIKLGNTTGYFTVKDVEKRFIRVGTIELKQQALSKGGTRK
ncbi:fimbria/pilus outer membrane usher protein [Pseudoalteromonas holothuriae]|nr:fimbria/pilus outer membrane usher protein [Pseudoalteromonas sp. CIP111951]